MNCLLCDHKRCCKQFKVQLTYEEYVLGFYEVDPEQEKKKFIVLKRKPSGEECIYLVNQCSIYKNRPEACREFDCTGDERIQPANSPEPSAIKPPQPW